MHALRLAEPGLDWLVAIPPAGLSAQSTAEDGYALAAHTVTPQQLASALSYRQLAKVVADQIQAPTPHRQQVAVLPSPTP